MGVCAGCASYALSRRYWMTCGGNGARCDSVGTSFPRFTNRRQFLHASRRPHIGHTSAHSGGSLLVLKRGGHARFFFAEMCPLYMGFVSATSRHHVLVGPFDLLLGLAPLVLHAVSLCSRPWQASRLIPSGFEVSVVFEDGRDKNMIFEHGYFFACALHINV